MREIVKVSKSMWNDIKRTLKNNGLSQTWLAESIGVSKSTLSRYINGSRNISKEKVHLIFDIFADLKMKERRYYHSKDKLINLGKKGKVEYEAYFNPITEKYDSTIPVCPFCNEPAYEDDYCVFCGAEFIKPTKEEMEYQRELNHEYQATYKNITAQQCNNSIYLYINGRLWQHLTLAKAFSKEELQEFVKREYESRYGSKD